MFTRCSSIFKKSHGISSSKNLSSIAIDSFNKEYVTIRLDGKSPVQFSTTFLRDACKGKESVDPYSGQKLFTTAEVTKGLSITGTPAVEICPNTNEELLRLDWNQNGKIHTSHYPKSFLEKYMTHGGRFKDRFFYEERVEWDKSKILSVLGELNVDFDTFLKDDRNFNQSVKHLNKYGLSIVKNIPDPVESLGLNEMNEENALQWPVAHLASKFGYIKKTFYGTLFDVRNKKEAINIAYTKSFLPLHMDLLYYESPPGVQLLHFIRNSTEGGENVFCDSFLAATYVRENDPQAYEAMKNVHVSYHYDNDNEYYYYSRPMIVEDDSLVDHTGLPQIKEVNYSPPFQAPFDFGIVKNPPNSKDGTIVSAQESSQNYLFKDFTRGLQLFEEFISEPKNQYLVKFDEGDCVVFDNRRILHSRLEFSDANGGDRWLMGTYVDGDSFRSRLRISHRKYK